MKKRVNRVYPHIIIEIQYERVGKWVGNEIDGGEEIIKTKLSL